MKFTVSYSRKVNLGQYEMASLSLEMEFDTEKITPQDAFNQVMEIVEDKAKSLSPKVTVTLKKPEISKTEGVEKNNA
jgi:hypothetical protein